MHAHAALTLDALLHFTQRQRGYHTETCADGQEKHNRHYIGEHPISTVGRFMGLLKNYPLL